MFYYWSTAVEEDLEDARLAELSRSIQDEVPGCGDWRVTHELRRRGHVVNYNRVARLMRAQGLDVKLRRRFVRTTDSKHEAPICPNLYCNVIPTRQNVVGTRLSSTRRIRISTCSASSLVRMNLWCWAIDCDGKGLTMTPGGIACTDGAGIADRGGAQ
jgi:putative transposase